MPYYYKPKKKKKEDKYPLFTANGIKVKRKPNLRDKLDREFSMFIRLRDSKPYGYKYFQCPTCGRVLPFEQADCSHYFSRTHLSTRYDEMNCMAECRFDNRFNAEHLHKLGEALVKRIGEKNFALLEWRHNQPKKYTDFELQELIKYYKQKNKEMLEERVL